MTYFPSKTKMRDRYGLDRLMVTTNGRSIHLRVMRRPTCEARCCRRQGRPATQLDIMDQRMLMCARCFG